MHEFTTVVSTLTIAFRHLVCDTSKTTPVAITYPTMHTAVILVRTYRTRYQAHLLPVEAIKPAFVLVNGPYFLVSVTVISVVFGFPQ
jgi:hypothetical protein